MSKGRSKRKRGGWKHCAILNRRVRRVLTTSLGMALTSAQWRNARIEALTQTLIRMRPGRRCADRTLATLITTELAILQAAETGDDIGLERGKWAWSTSPAFGATSVDADVQNQTQGSYQVAETLSVPRCASTSAQ